MSLPLPLFIGLRYLRPRRRQRFISFISAVSTLGIALGLVAVIAVMSVMNGFHTEIRDRLLGMVAHVSVTQPGGRLAGWEGVAGRVAAHPQVVAAAPFIEGQAMLTHRGRVSGVGLRGVLPEREREAAGTPARMVAGALEELAAGGYRIVLGEELAQHLGARVGDRVTLVVPRATSTPAGVLPRLKSFEVSGLFRFDMHRYDRHLALLHLDDAARALGLGGGVSGVKLRTLDLFRAPLTAADLREELGAGYRVFDWSELNRGFFRAIQMEKTMLFLLLMLIVLVAAFNIVSALLMTVQEKRGDIAVLRTLGMTRRGVLQVFLLQGLAIGVSGAVLGVAGGVALSLNLGPVVSAIEAVFDFKVFAPEVYYLSEIPSRLLWSDVALAGGVSLALAVGAALYPARRALRVPPAEVLRYE